MKPKRLPGRWLARWRKLLLRALTGLGLLVLVLGGVVMKEFLNGRPCRWDPTDATMNYNGTELVGHVYERQGDYLLDLPPGRGLRTLALHIKMGGVSAGLSARAFLGTLRTPIPGGVLLLKNGKAETEAIVWKTADGYRIRLLPSMADRTPGSSDEISLHFARAR